jgi:hypothetical protein
MELQEYLGEMHQFHTTKTVQKYQNYSTNLAEKYDVKTRNNVVAVSYSSCPVQDSITMNLQIVDCKNQQIKYLNFQACPVATLKIPRFY